MTSYVTSTDGTRIAFDRLGEGPPVREWGADAILDTPADLLNWLGVA